MGVRLFDETSAALRFPYGKQTLTEAEILNKLSDSNPESRKIAGKSLSKILKDNSRLFGMILNVISRDKYVEDSKRGFGSILESRNLDNDIENKVIRSNKISRNKFKLFFEIIDPYILVSKMEVKTAGNCGCGNDAGGNY